jgi:hypothetical protein
MSIFMQDRSGNAETFSGPGQGMTRSKDRDVPNPGHVTRSLMMSGGEQGKGDSLDIQAILRIMFGLNP